jgi:hypothetical protein
MHEQTMYFVSGNYRIDKLHSRSYSLHFMQEYNFVGFEAESHFHLLGRPSLEMHSR